MSDFCLPSNEQIFSYIMAEQVTFSDDDDVQFVLDQWPGWLNETGS